MSTPLRRGEPGAHLVPPLWATNEGQVLSHGGHAVVPLEVVLPLVAGKGEGDATVDKQPVIESIAAIREATADGKALPSPAYIMVFPIISAVLSWPVPSPLHEPALSALALHVSPSVCLPRTAMLALLYQVLETMPAYRYSSGPVLNAILIQLQVAHTTYESLLRHCHRTPTHERCEVLYCREKVQPLLQSLCRGVSEQEVPAALRGLLANSAHTRFAALSALHLLPCLPTGTLNHTLLLRADHRLHNDFSQLAGDSSHC